MLPRKTKSRNAEGSVATSCGSFSFLEWAITWGRRNVDPSGGASRNELHRDRNCRCASLVPQNMHALVAALVDEGGAWCACYMDLGRAGRIVAFICGNGAHRDCDQAGTGVGMPPSLTSRSERISDYVEVRFSLRVDPEPPVVARLGKEVHLGEGRATSRATNDELRHQTRRGSCEGRHGCQRSDAER